MRHHFVLGIMVSSVFRQPFVIVDLFQHEVHIDMSDLLPCIHWFYIIQDSSVWINKFDFCCMLVFHEFFAYSLSVISFKTDYKFLQPQEWSRHWFHCQIKQTWPILEMVFSAWGNLFIFLFTLLLNCVTDSWLLTFKFMINCIDCRVFLYLMYSSRSVSEKWSYLRCV